MRGWALERPLTFFSILLLVLLPNPSNPHHPNYENGKSCREGKDLIPLAVVGLDEKAEIQQNEKKLQSEEKKLSHNCKSGKCTYDWSGKLSDHVCVALDDEHQKCTICFGVPGTIGGGPPGKNFAHESSSSETVGPLPRIIIWANAIFTIALFVI